MAIASGQYTIVDFNDSVTLSGQIGANLARQVQYDPNAAIGSEYSPNWATTNLVLTPQIFKMGGGGTDLYGDAQVTATTWYHMVNGVKTLCTVGTDFAFSGAKSTLTVKTNFLANATSKEFICEVTYHDSLLPAGSQYDMLFPLSIVFTKANNGTGLVAAYVTYDTDTFKNSAPATINIQGTLWRGSIKDTTGIACQWYQQDGSVVTDQGGGVGWRKLLADSTKYTGETTATLVLKPAGVSGIGAFKVGITDNEVGSATNGTTFFDTVVIHDESDPYGVSIWSSGGDTFKNAIGNTTLMCRLIQAGIEVDTCPAPVANRSGTAPGSPVNGTYWLDTSTGILKQYNGSSWITASYSHTFTYTWYCYKADGSLDTSWGTAGSKTGKYQFINDTMVTSKATFTCDVS